MISLTKIVASGSVDKPIKVITWWFLLTRRCFLFVLLIKPVKIYPGCSVDKPNERFLFGDSVNKSSKIFPGCSVDKPYERFLFGDSVNKSINIFPVCSVDKSNKIKIYGFC